MNRREALAKATITTSTAATAMLDPQQATAFIWAIKDSSEWGRSIRTEVRGAPSGEIDKAATASRIIRSAPENADDGYRAGATFDTVPYQTVKVRLPWEVTEDVFHENLAGEALEAQLTAQMTQQFALDLDDLDINGDTAAVGADAAFLNIDDGILVQIEDAAITDRLIDGAAINAGAISKDHFFAAYYAMPQRIRNRGSLRWICSPNRTVSWWEALTERAGAQGDALLGSRGASAATGPLAIPFLEVSGMPDDTLLLADPQNFVRVVSWQIRRRRVTGETDSALAARDKRFYVFFLKRDIIIEEADYVVRVDGLDAPA